MSSTSWNAASIVGPVVAGYLILLLDRRIYDVIALASAATLIGYLFIPSIRIPSGEGRSAEDVTGWYPIRPWKTNHSWWADDRPIDGGFRISHGPFTGVRR